MAIKKNREIQTKDRDERIESMGMDELKKYLCYKNNQDPTKCDGCPGSRTCKAGQRAIVLLNEMERAKMNAENPVKNSTKGKTMAEIQENARRCFLDAVSRPDMIQYVMQTYGNNRNSAREKLKNWARSHPDIAEQTDFWDKFNALSQKMPQGFKDKMDGRTSEAVRKYMEAMEQENPVQFLMDKYGMDRKNASHTYYQCRSRYKDIVPKLKEESMQTKPAEPEEDDVSIEDFLKEYAPNEDAPAVSVNSEVHAENDMTTCSVDFNAELTAKYNQLAKDRADLLARIEWIDKAMEALTVTMSLFSREGESA